MATTNRPYLLINTTQPLSDEQKDFGMKNLGVSAAIATETNSRIAAIATETNSRIATDTALQNQINAAIGVTAGDYGPSGPTAPGFGGSFRVPKFTVNTLGKVISAENVDVTLPDISEGPTGPTGHGFSNLCEGGLVRRHQRHVLSGLEDQ